MYIKAAYRMHMKTLYHMHTKTAYHIHAKHMHIRSMLQYFFVYQYQNFQILFGVPFTCIFMRPSYNGQTLSLKHENVKLGRCYRETIDLLDEKFHSLLLCHTLGLSVRKSCLSVGTEIVQTTLNTLSMFLVTDFLVSYHSYQF